MSHAPERPHATPPGSTPTRGAGGVVFDDHGRVLVMQHTSGPWVFPKGHIDPGETDLQAALREVLEEAGIHAHAPHPHETHETHYTNDRGEPRSITWYALRAAPGSERLDRIEDTFTRADWLPPADARERLTFHEDRTLLDQMLATMTSWQPRSPGDA